MPAGRRQGVSFGGNFDGIYDYFQNLRNLHKATSQPQNSLQFHYIRQAKKCKI